MSMGSSTQQADQDNDLFTLLDDNDSVTEIELSDVEIVATREAPPLRRAGSSSREDLLEGDRALVALLETQADREGADLVPAVKFGKRSAELMEHARAVRARRIQARIDEASAEALKECQQMLVNVADAGNMMHLVPAEVKKMNDVSLEDKAGRLVMRAVTMPRTHQKPQARYHVGVATKTLADAVIKQETQWIEQVLFPAPDSERSGRVVETLAVCHQFDEATQKCRSMLPPRQWKGLVLSSAPRSVQMMVQSGEVHVWHTNPANLEDLIYEQEPWICKSVIVRRQTADSILEALFMRMALPLGDVEKCKAMLEVAHWIILNICCDRFSANLAAMRFIWSVIHHDIGSRMLPHVELCWSHGVSLAKSCAHETKEVVAACVSLSKMLKISKNVEELMEAMIQVLETKVWVIKNRRPDDDIERVQKLLEVIYGNPDTPKGAYLYKMKASGERIPSRLLLDIQQLTAEARL